MALNECTDLAADAAAKSSLRRDAMSHANMLSCYVGLLCLGKSDFEAIDGFREGAFFATALDLEQVSSDGIPRQCMDAHGAAHKRVVVNAR